MLLTKDYQNVANYTWNVTSNQKVIFYLDAKIGDYDISNNRTPIYTRLRSTINITPAGGSGYKFTCTYAPTVEGSAVWYFGNETITETNTTEYVYHNEDGTANITLTSSVYNGYLGLNQTFSGTATLPTIPRKSSVTATSTTIGGACSININQKSDTFTHTLRYSFGNLNGTITTGVKYSYGWTVPNDFYSQIPNAPSGTATIYCDTYNGGTLIGTTSTTTIFNANENETKPSVSMSAKDINPITSQLTSGANESTKIVKGFSNVQITWSSTPKQYASIKSNAINGTSVSESPYTFYNANTNIFTFIATDTRGFKNSISTTNTSNPLIDYIPLQINPNFYRKAPTTGEVMLEFTGNYFNNKFGENGVNNELHIGYKYREKGSETSWDDIAENEISSDLYTINDNIINSNAPISLGTIYDYKKNYEFILLFKDKIVDTYVSKIVPKGKPIFWWDENGVYDGNTNLPLVEVEIGSLENGRYEKYSNGMLKCYYTQTISTAIKNSWGSLFVSPVIQLQDYPITFKAITSLNMSVVGVFASAWIINGGDYSLYRPCPIQLCAANPINLPNDFRISVCAIGTWK